MPDLSKVSILLADEDNLRRDGLAAVLAKNDGFEVVGGVADGGNALDQIRDLRPEVAVIDLNLPVLHGIELVRRVRGESLGTKIVILASTDNDDIVREVVRAGADAYLLKNGPARHLIDAINYVRDGGQYFSPQLKRDGRDRHLLEEPARIPPERAYREDADERDFEEPAEPRIERRRANAPRGRNPGRRSTDPSSLRQRIRDEVTDADMGDRDYEIMSMMADGIRPILDRLDEIDSRVSNMETGDEPLPDNPRGWLTSQLADSLGRRGGGDTGLARNVNEIEATLPQLIEEAVTKRFHQMAGKLQEEIEETHVRTLETFVKNIQVKLVHRVSALEQDMSQQAQAMSQLQEYSQRTEDNLSRLISGVDKLAQELPKRLAAAAAEPVTVESEAPERERPAEHSSAPRPPAAANAGSGTRRKKTKSVPLNMKKIWAIAALLILLTGVGFGLKSFLSKEDEDLLVEGDLPAETASVEKKTKREPVSAGTDTVSRMKAAQEYMDRKEYQMAESLYRQITSEEPSNAEALQGLASVLYRQDKIEEAATILDKLPK